MPQPRDYQRRDNEWQASLRRALDLSPEDQLRVHAALTESLGGRLGQESERQRQARLRGEALEAMRLAAKHLDLPDGQAPSVNEYKQAARETKLPMSFNAVYAAFERRWEVATAFFRGERIPLTAAQRATRRRSVGTQRSRPGPVESLRLYLEQQPPPPLPANADYEQWAKEHNESAAMEDRVIEGSANIRMGLRVTWQDALAVALNEKDLDTAQQEQLTQLLHDSGPLVGHALAAWMLGWSPSVFNKYRRRTGFPRPVVQLSGGPAWLRSDIEEYASGRQDFSSKEFTLQDEFLGTKELAQRLGPSKVYDERWDVVPPPAGKAARSLYWSGLARRSLGRGTLKQQRGKGTRF